MQILENNKCAQMESCVVHFSGQNVITLFVNLCQHSRKKN